MKSERVELKRYKNAPYRGRDGELTVENVSFRYRKQNFNFHINFKNKALLKKIYKPHLYINKYIVIGNINIEVCSK